MRKVAPRDQIRIVNVYKNKQRYENLRKLNRTIRLQQIKRRRDSHTQMLISQGLVAGKDLNRRPIILPEIFSFWENYDATSLALAEIREYGVNKRIPLDIRFDNVKNLDPSATLALAAEIFRCRKLRVYRRGVFVTGNYPQSNDVLAHLSEMGFFRLLEITDICDRQLLDTDNQRPLFLKFITDMKVDGATVNAFVGIIERHIVGLNAVARGKLVGAIKEAMGNVNEHAYKDSTKYQSMKKRWFLSSRVNPATHEVMIMLYDQGVGIPNTISTDLLETIGAALAGHIDRKLHVSDGYTIKLATEIWRTGTGQSGRGRGFRDMKQFIDLATDGELRVLSNRGSYTYISNDNESSDSLTRSLDGTIIEWRFRSDNPLEMTDD